MTRTITDPVLARKLQLRHEILALAHRQQAHPAEWTAADEKEWNRVNTEFDRLEAAQPFDRLIGRDNGDPTKGPVNRDYFSQRGIGMEQPAGDVLDRAVCGWAKNQLGVPITGADVEACQQYGVSAASNVFAVPFKPSLPRTGREMFAPANALSTGQDTAGGFTVPGSFVARLEQAMLHSSGILQACEVMRTSDGRELPWPTTNDTANEGALVGENQESTEQDATFGRLVFRAFKLTSKLVRVSHELVRDAGIDLASELGSMLGTRIGRKLNRLCTTGTGGGIEPWGIVTASTLGKTAASATAIQFDELIDLMHSVDVAYRTAEAGFGFMLHDNVAANVRKLKDGNGDYLWQQSTQLGQPDRLLGWPVFLNNHMDSTIATGKKTVLAGAFRKYKVRLVAELRLRRLVERYAEFDQEGFLAFQEVDGGLLDAGTNPVKHLIQ